LSRIATVFGISVINRLFELVKDYWLNQ